MIVLDPCSRTWPGSFRDRVSIVETQNTITLCIMQGQGVSKSMRAFRRCINLFHLKLDPELSCPIDYEHLSIKRQERVQAEVSFGHTECYHRIITNSSHAPRNGVAPEEARAPEERHAASLLRRRGSSQQFPKIRVMPRMALVCLDCSAFSSSWMPPAGAGWRQKARTVSRITRPISDMAAARSSRAAPVIKVTSGDAGTNFDARSCGGVKHPNMRSRNPFARCRTCPTKTIDPRVVRLPVRMQNRSFFPCPARNPRILRCVHGLRSSVCAVEKRTARWLIVSDPLSTSTQQHSERGA